MTMPSTFRSKQKEAQTENQPAIEKTTQSSLPSSFRQKQKKETTTESIIENIKEVPTQLSKGVLTGATSFGGDILDILGLQSKKVLPGEESKRSREFTTLEKLEKGEIPSIAELSDLSDDDVQPLYSRLPTSPEARSFLEELGFPKAKRVAGRYGQRVGEFLGTPGGSGKAAIGAAIAGQTAEELGAPAWLQALTEIGTSLKLSKSKTPISSSSPNVQKELQNLRSMGLSEKDLTLARNALEDRGFLKKSSKYTREAENKFKETFKNTKKNVDSIIEESFPSLQEQGPQTFKNAAVDLFDSLDSFGREVKIKNPRVFTKAVDKAIEEMERSLATSPQKKDAIEMLKSAKTKSYRKDVSGDHYTNFYKELNAVGNWGNPKQRESAFGAVKNAIKDTFKAQGPEGIKLAESLEEANKSWMKYLNAEDISNVLTKSSTDEGINFKKLHTALQKSENYEAFKKGLGEKQTNNLIKLSEITSQIGDLEKSMKGGLAKDLISQGTLYGFAKAVFTGDLLSLKTMVGIQIAGTFATKLLTDPSYQNISLRMARAAKDQKWNVVKSLSRALESKTKKDSAFVKKIKTKNNPKSK